MSRLEIPPDTEQLWILGGRIDEVCNQFVRRMSGDWLWIMGDDHTFPPDILIRLLEWDVDIVSPLCLSRYPPFPTAAYKARNEPLQLGEWVGAGLLEVYACGSAGMLVKRRVFEAVEHPWFAFGYDEEGRVNEDMSFGGKAREAGFKSYVDTDTILGHITPAVLYPSYNGAGSWSVGLAVADNLRVTL